MGTSQWSKALANEAEKRKTALQAKEVEKRAINARHDALKVAIKNILTKESVNNSIQEILNEGMASEPYATLTSKLSIPMLVRQRRIEVRRALGEVLSEETSSLD